MDAVLLFCNRCGFIGLPVDEVLKHLLNVLYSSPYSMSGTTIGQEDSAYSRRLAESFFGIFSRLSPGCIPKKILEVGCQRGYLLHEFQQRGVERAIGVEPGDIEPWIDENGGIVDIRRGYLSRDIVGEDDFDFVFSLSVFEHVEKPKEFLQIIHNLLRPGGRLLVAVPNEVFSLQAGNIGMFLFQHLNYFTPELLKTIFATCGFHVTGIISSRELPLYVIAEKGGAKEGSGIDADVKAKTRRRSSQAIKKE